MRDTERHASKTWDHQQPLFAPKKNPDVLPHRDLSERIVMLTELRWQPRFSTIQIYG
jgi:hypothetical protein